MQRNYYTDRFLNEDFEEAIRSKEKQVLEKYSEEQLKNLYFDNAQKINQALIDFKPNRHQKESFINYKRTMLEYLDRCIIEDLSNMEYRDKLEYKEQYVNKVTNNLTFLGFRTDNYVFFFIGFGIIVDILLVLFGLAKYYYYIPIITILITYYQLKGLYKAKKSGKLLR